jgi:phytoene/squalene synthetase
MDKELARRISDLMLDVTARLDESVALVQERGSAEELERYRGAVARILGEMLLEVLNPIYEEHPELKPPELGQEPDAAQ